eukprot:GHVU01088593.1.p1 GENE.GHVU01088593.1~~GHVU01088593.1.p1  ORF type:complete len:117 (-),score=0.82 GHVU01088593.1:424-774(-)
MSIKPFKTASTNDRMQLYPLSCPIHYDLFVVLTLFVHCGHSNTIVNHVYVTNLVISTQVLKMYTIPNNYIKYHSISRSHWFIILLYKNHITNCLGFYHRHPDAENLLQKNVHSNYR